MLLGEPLPKRGVVFLIGGNLKNCPVFAKRPRKGMLRATFSIANRNDSKNGYEGAVL